MHLCEILIHKNLQNAYYMKKDIKYIKYILYLRNKANLNKNLIFA